MVHPHVCGEHAEQLVEQLDLLRYIPTPVGNRRSDGLSARISSVHLHACGEHHLPTGDDGRPAGTSPRLWGTSVCARGGGRRKWFIPTPVGNIARPFRWPRSPAVHPHACGEHLSQNSRSDEGRRFIPTPVGNICGSDTARGTHPVHPHACGEHVCAFCAPLSPAGSSPRLWGTSCKNHGLTLPRRFIPTPVGNINFKREISAFNSVHPHACGEH